MWQKVEFLNVTADAYAGNSLKIYTVLPENFL
jgi:hypothetical protein